MKRPCWVWSIECFYQCFLFLHSLCLLDLIGIEQCLDLRTQCCDASNIPVFGRVPFAHHFGMDIPQGEQESTDSDWNGIEEGNPRLQPGRLYQVPWYPE